MEIHVRRELLPERKIDEGLRPVREEIGTDAGDHADDPRMVGFSFWTICTSRPTGSSCLNSRRARVSSMMTMRSPPVANDSTSVKSRPPRRTMPIASK
jgi:hypothetical protein